MQQTVALGHGVVMGGDLARMGGLERPGKAVEETPTARSAFLEQPVHLRRQPDGGRAVGVEYTHRGTTVRAEAAREVILAGGALNSPQLLMLSVPRKAAPYLDGAPA
jgi:choline dehydrogenase-like flavoprotein